jgi:hypothetical protein
MDNFTAPPYLNVISRMNVKWSYAGDILAIPLFLWLFLYFFKKKEKTLEEKGLMIFAAGGFIADTLFVSQVLK